MNVSLIRFIRGRGLGEIRLGMSRADILARLGPPKDWVGKEGFGQRIPTPEKSWVWRYYQNALGARFDDLDEVESIFVDPSEIKVPEKPFDDWSIGAGATMADFRELLYQNGIEFKESWPGDPYYILVNDNCLCSTSMFPPKTRETPPSDREIGSIKIFLETSDAANFVKDISQAWLPRWSS